MEGSRLEKLRELAERKQAYPYRFEISTQIGDIRNEYEKPTEDREILLRGTVKRSSKIEEGYLLRLASSKGTEMLAITQQELKVGQECFLKGRLGRYEGKLCLYDAVLWEGQALEIEDIKPLYDLDPNFEEVSLAGRLITLRSMGKAIFGHLQDATGRIQIYLKRDIVGEESFKEFEELVDTGDILGVRGKLFRTNTGELTVEVESFQILSKSLHPMPEKWHGIRDVEVRYRQRYLDLIANEEARKIFLLRSKVIKELRNFLDKEGFLEVETPILQHIASGANAKPFITYHNYLEQNLYLRIAPELYLKRLIVGGFNKVYELGRNFRNEGVDTTHNPEFTMVEFYTAYWDYKDLMDFTERLLSHVLLSTVGSLKLTYGGKELDFTPPYKRYRYFELLEEKTGKDRDFFLKDVEGLRRFAKEIGVPKAEKLTHAKLIDKVFDLLVEDELWGPCFVLDFPKILSPLAKSHREDPDLVERFELFVAGKELANAYTELNDPFEQRERFLEQLREKEMGDEEAMQMDEDFITALEYGMPPTAGEGIGIDRLVMILADVDSIRGGYTLSSLEEGLMEFEKKPIREFKAKVVKVIQETPSSKTLVFDISHVDFDFYPGQYIMVNVPYEGQVLKRAYSIASPPTQTDTLELTIKKVPNGKASVYLTEEVKVGDEFLLKGPYGKFVWIPQMGTSLVLIGAGSGIVPLMCILRYIVSAKLEHVKATLLYSNTHYEEIIYREELERMDKHSNIEVVHTLTRSYPSDWKGYTGRINVEMILKEVEDIPTNLYYLCGPPAFVEDTASMLLELGVDKNQIKKEKYD